MSPILGINSKLVLFQVIVAHTRCNADTFRHQGLVEHVVKQGITDAVLSQLINVLVSLINLYMTKSTSKNDPY